jgi:PBP1b-binding outer membrane lipoprotein LpoB
MNKLLKIEMAILAILMLVSCGSTKSTAVESKVEKTRSVEGDKVVVETTELQGIEMIETLNEDGTKIIKRPYRWFAGIGKADDKQTAIEIAEHEARANVSRSIETMVMATVEKGALVNNQKVQEALTSHWKQVSSNILNGCESLGAAKVEYNKNTNMYTATVKVGMRGDRFQQLMDKAASYKPSNLSGNDLNQFIETNKTIIGAAKGE